MTAAVETADGVFLVDLEADELVGHEETPLERVPEPRVALPLVVAAAAVGSTVIALVDRRPPLAISNDAGRTWREAGGGLPRGVAVALDDENPDHAVFAARNRLYVSEDGGRFWRALSVELPEIAAIELRA